MRYKLLGRSGLRVSEISLGTMTFGTEWGWGADKEESRKIFDYYLEAGGNFIDTANRYTEGSSEIFLGEFIKDTGKRDEIVLATKYSLYTKPGKLNDSGNHRKNLVQSLEGSLKRLEMEYVDLLYLHAWDYTTPVDEVMRALDDLVSQGKVLYIGISDTPAWVVSQANTLADLTGRSPFVALQVEYSLIQRDVERELIPMANSLDLAVVPWAPLAGGALTGKYLVAAGEEGRRLKPESKRLDARSTAIAQKVVDIAKEIGCSPSHVAINWVRSRSEQMFPILGSKNLEQIKDNLDALKYTLSQEQISALTEVSRIELGFPHDFLLSDGPRQLLYGGFYDKMDNHREPRVK